MCIYLFNVYSVKISLSISRLTLVWQTPLHELNQYLTELENALEDSSFTGRSVALGIGAAHAAAVLISFARYSQNCSDLVCRFILCLLLYEPFKRSDSNKLFIKIILMTFHSRFLLAHWFDIVCSQAAARLWCRIGLTPLNKIDPEDITDVLRWPW